MNTIRNNSKKISFEDLHPVREIRKKLNLTQPQLSNLIGLKQSQLSACELGKRTLSIKAAKKLIFIAKEYGHTYSLDFVYSD